MSVQQQNPGAQTRLSEFLSFLFVQAITLRLLLGKETSRLEIISIILNLKNVYIVSWLHFFILITTQEVAEKISFYLRFIHWPNCFTKVCEEMKDVEL